MDWIASCARNDGGRWTVRNDGGVTPTNTIDNGVQRLKTLTKLIKNKKGLTLMELIVGMLMFTIIAITLSVILAPILSAYTRANDFAEYNALLDNIANQIISDLSQSRDLSKEIPPVINPRFIPSTDPEAGGWADSTGGTLTIVTQNRIIYSVEGGILQRNEHDVFAADFYKRKHVSFRLVGNPPTPTSPRSYTLTVRLTEAREPGAASFEIQREYAVRPLMLNQG